LRLVSVRSVRYLAPRFLRSPAAAAVYEFLWACHLD
jgi:hypothetical protein